MLSEVFFRKYRDGETFMDDEAEYSLMKNRLNSLVMIVKGSVDILDEQGSTTGKLVEGDFFGDLYPIFS